MAQQSSKEKQTSRNEDIQINVGKDLSTAIIQGLIVEVSPDNNVVMYTNKGVQIKPATSSSEAASAKEDTHLSIGKDFNTVALYSAKIELAADGGVIVYTNGTVKLKAAPANDSVEPKIGDKMLDGTLFAGISPDTDKPMYAAPSDASLTMEFNQAKEYAAKLGAHSHKDWRVPTKNELKVLFNNRAAIGGFDISGSDPAGWYWSSSQYSGWYAWGQRFSDGCQDDKDKDGRSSVRCVR
jgi:Protein of unknown function (DUF1566)